jgi:hypothetical protein
MAKVVNCVRVGVALSVLALCSACEAPPEPSSIRTNVEALASDALEGRMTGTPGIEQAAAHIVAELEAIGAEPLPGNAGYRLPFQYTGTASDGGTSLRLVTDDGPRWSDPESVRALSFSEGGEVTGELVFVGYGLVVPETDGFSYDSYATIDVTDKIVVVLRYSPEDAEQDLRVMFSRYAGLRFKAQAARQRGAKGLLVVTGPRSPNAGAMVPMTADTAVADSGIAAASVSLAVAETLFELVPDRTLEEAQRELDSGNPHVAGFEIPADATLDAQVIREQRTGHNVVAYLPPTMDQSVEKPYVLLGAHYDHLGRGDQSSLAKADEAGDIHNGADDNASGVAAVLAAGAELARQDRARGVILAFWSGEEIGMLGSADFVDNSPVRMDQIAAYVNFDMVGRMRDNKLTVQALGSSTIWPDLVEEINESFDFDLQPVIDPYLPTDAMSLNLAEVPTLALFTGSHEDYHRPTDDADTVNYPDLERVASYGAAVAARLVNAPAPPDFIRVERIAQQGGQSAMRIFTGTIPDYSSEVDGLRLSGVMGGGPAEKAGLQEADIIVELAGQSVANIYDYMFALDLLKVGQPAAVVFMRGDERVETELVPEARQ